MPQLAPVKFAKPPVVEVVCGVLFGTPQPLKTVHIGLFAQSLRGEFPVVEEKDPLGPVIEPLPGHEQFTQLEFLTLPPLRRTWLISPDRRNLIQLQQDRFLFNWKKSEADDTYPSYQLVIERFNSYLRRFADFLVVEGIGCPTYRQYELTYVNHIQTSNGLDAGLGNILVDHIRTERKDRFLPEPEAFNWATSYPLPNDSGRLHVIAQTALRLDGGARTPILRLDMTARGMPSNTDDDARTAWFDVAHDWITHGFVDCTSAALQEKYWERK